MDEENKAQRIVYLIHSEFPIKDIILEKNYCHYWCKHIALELSSEKMSEGILASVNVLKSKLEDEMKELHLIK